MVDAGAVRITSSPAQNVVGPSAVITGCGGRAFTITVTLELVELNPSLTTTVYTVVTVGVTVGVAEVEVKVPGEELQL